MTRIPYHMPIRAAGELQVFSGMFLRFLLGCALGCSAWSISAIDRYWTGRAGDNLWSSVNNWEPIGRIRTGDQLIFGDPDKDQGAVAGELVDDLPDVILGGLKFGGDTFGFGIATTSGPLTIDGQITVEHVNSAGGVDFQGPVKFLSHGIYMGSDSHAVFLSSGAYVTFHSSVEFGPNGYVHVNPEDANVFSHGFFGFSNTGEVAIFGEIKLNGDLVLTADSDAYNGSAAHIKVSEILGNGNVTAKVVQGDDNWISFESPINNGFHGSLRLTSDFLAGASPNDSVFPKFIFNKPSGALVSSNIVVTAGDTVKVEVRPGASLGRAATIWLGEGAHFVLPQSPDIIELGSLQLSNASADASPTRFDMGQNWVRLYGGITAQVNNDHVHPTIQGFQLELMNKALMDASGGTQPALEISSRLAGKGFQKKGEGTLVLSAANSFSDDAGILEGTLKIQHPSALAFDPPNHGVHLQGGALLLDNLSIPGVSLVVDPSSSGTIPRALEAFSTRGLAVVGNRPSGTPSTLLVNNQCAWTGPVDIEGTLTVVPERVERTVNNLELSGPISGSGALELQAASLTVRYSGTLGNAFSGSTAVHCQRLELAKTPGIHAITGPLFIGGEDSVGCEVRWFNRFQAEGAVVTINANGLLSLKGENEQFGTLIFNGGHVETERGHLRFSAPIKVNASTTSALIAGIVELSSTANAVFDVSKGAADPALIVDAVISDAVLSPQSVLVIKQGLGTIRFSGANTYTGSTDINEGVLEVDNAAGLGAPSLTQVAENATLRLRGIATLPESITLKGTGALGSDGTRLGALQMSANASITWSGFFQLLGPAAINTSAGSSLNIASAITGVGSLTTIGAGVVRFSGNQPNTYLGDTLVKNNALIVAKPSSTAAIPGHLVIGGSGPASVQNASSFNIPGSITVDRGGVWDLNGQNEVINQPPLQLNNGGSIRTGSGTLFLPGGGGIVVNPGPAGSSTLSGRIGLNPGNHTITVIGRVLGLDGPECRISGILSEAAPGASLTKDGTGWLFVSGTNTYGGATVVSGGAFQLEGVAPPGLIQVNSGNLQGSALMGAITMNGTAGAVVPRASTGIMTCNSFNASAAGGGTLRVQLNGTKPGSGYDQLVVRGLCNLAGITLNASLGFHSTAGDTFTIVQATPDNPVQGTFNGLPEGATLTISGEQFRITYQANGGTGVVLTQLSALAAQSSIWTNALGGDWSIAGNWDPNAVPSSSNAGITNNGTYMITNNANSVVARFYYNNPFSTVTGSGSLTASNLFIWEAGAFNNAGIVMPAGGLHITGPASSAPRLLSGTTLVNTGQAAWSEDGTLQLSGGAILSNAPAGTFDCLGDGTLQNGSGSNRVENAGLFRKLGGTNVTRIDVPFFNMGTIEVQSGTLSLNNGGTNVGTIAVRAGSSLNLGGSHVFLPGSAITGAGSIAVNPSGGEITLSGQMNLTGTHTFSGGTVNLDGEYTYGGTDLAITSGTLNLNGTGIVAPSSLTLGTFATLGGTNPITVNGPLNWGSSSTISGNNVVIANGPMTISGNVFLQGRTLVNTVSALWTNDIAGAIQLSNDAVISNAPNALFECRGKGIVQNGPGTNLFANAGWLRRTGDTNETRIDAFFLNEGDVNVDSGTLSLYRGGEETGAFVVAAGATLALMDGTHHFDPASTIHGEGDFQVGGGIANLEGSMNLTGTHSFTFGTANITGNYNCIGNHLVIRGGTALFNGSGSITPDELDIGLFGNLGGSNRVIVSGAMVLSSGAQISGSGAIIANGGISLSGNISLNGRTLVNAGRAVWTNDVPASITLAEGAILSNEAGAVFEMSFDGQFNNSIGSNAFVNAGIFRKTAGNGSAPIAVPFVNTGTVDIQSGALNFVNGTFTQTDGVTELSGGNLISSSPVHLLGGVLSGSGVIAGSVINAATIRPAGPLASSGQRARSAMRLSQSRGQIIITGDYTQTSDGVLELAIGGTNISDFASLVVSNSMTLGGTLHVIFTDGFTPPPNARFAFLSSSNVLGNFARVDLSTGGPALALAVTGTNAALQVLNVRPALDPVSDQTIDRSSTLRLQLSAKDSDTPSQTLSYSFLGPAAANIDQNGLLTWAPATTDPVTNTFTVFVTDNGLPPLSASISFVVVLLGAAPEPSLSIRQGSDSDSFVLSLLASPGASFLTEFTSQLPGPWSPLSTNLAGPNGTWTVTDSTATNSARFYRARAAIGH